MNLHVCRNPNLLHTTLSYPSMLMILSPPSSCASDDCVLSQPFKIYEIHPSLNVEESDSGGFDILEETELRIFRERLQIWKIPYSWR